MCLGCIDVFGYWAAPRDDRRDSWTQRVGLHRDWNTGRLHELWEEVECIRLGMGDSVRARHERDERRASCGLIRAGSVMSVVNQRRILQSCIYYHYGSSGTGPDLMPPRRSGTRRYILFGTAD